MDIFCHLRNTTPSYRGIKIYLAAGSILLCKCTCPTISSISKTLITPACYDSHTAKYSDMAE